MPNRKALNTETHRTQRKNTKRISSCFFSVLSVSLCSFLFLIPRNSWAQTTDWKLQLNASSKPPDGKDDLRFHFYHLATAIPPPFYQGVWYFQLYSKESGYGFEPGSKIQPADHSV